jgi:hypothetical protein
MTVYAAPYIRLTDGSVQLGEVKTRSFRELTELADARYSQDTLPEELRELYSKFSPAMDTWNIPNLKK